MKRVLLAIAFLFIANAAYAQSTITSATCPGTGCIKIDVGGQGSLGFQILDNFTGTLSFRVSQSTRSDDNCVTGYEVLLVRPSGSTTDVSSTTGAGIFSTPVAGWNTVCIIASVGWMGTATVIKRSTSQVRYNIPPTAGATVSEITTSGPIVGGPITTTGNISCPTCATNDATFLVNALSANLTNEVVTNLFQDATDTLAMRRGTNPQRMYFYKTYTDAGNYERLGIDTATVASQFRITTEALGTGAIRDLWIIGNNSITVAPEPFTDFVISNSSGQTRWIFPQGGNILYPSGNEFASVGTPTVGNVGADSCGTSAATIVGRNAAGKVTVGATSGTQCRVTFSAAFAANAPSCTASNETTAALVRTNSTTARVDLLGAFTAGDVLAYVCLGY